MTQVYTWGSIALVVLASTAGDVLLSHAMRRIGDLGELRRRSGLTHVLGQVLLNGTFLLGVGCMAVAFFSLLVALSWADVSLVAPASASLTFVTSAMAAKFFLRENVDRRRWAAALMVCVGVALLNG
ncbi:MAG: EamA family transporter [Terriglobales bacterium]